LLLVSYTDAFPEGNNPLLFILTSHSNFTILHNMRGISFGLL
jgi:hypothetical protein